jgi:hypothetical protein
LRVGGRGCGEQQGEGGEISVHCGEASASFKPVKQRALD